MGTYDVIITLTDIRQHSNDYTLTITIVPDLINNSPPYFDDDWFDSQPIQLYFGGEQVVYTFPLPFDNDNE